MITRIKTRNTAFRLAAEYATKRDAELTTNQDFHDCPITDDAWPTVVLDDGVVVDFVPIQSGTMLSVQVYGADGCVFERDLYPETWTEDRITDLVIKASIQF